jgi:hypothetical protein
MNAIAEEKQLFVIEMKVKVDSSAAKTRMLAFVLVKYLLLIIFGPRADAARSTSFL